jgi:quercetin dioxygenase-like cupin family protein
MEIASFEKDLDYSEERIVSKVILESSFSKEIRILLKGGQVMKEHKAPFPIIVHVLEGEIDFGVSAKNHVLVKGSIISLDANIPHDLSAQKDSVVRLTLLKGDTAERVEKVADASQK